MALRKKTEKNDKSSSAPQEARIAPPQSEAKTRNKTSEIAGVICSLADLAGYFDPQDLYARVKETDLAKSAQIVVSNLRLQGFGREDRLRVPVSGGPDLVKQFLTLAGKLRKEKTDVSFEAAVGLLSGSQTPVQKSCPEPEPEPAMAHPDSKTEREMPVSTSTGKDYKALYEESREKALKLEGEVAAYKEMCSRLMENLKK